MARNSKADSIMGRKIQVCALSLFGAVCYATAASAQVAEAPSVAKPAEATAGTTEPNVVAEPAAPATPPIAHEPAAAQLPAAAPLPPPAPDAPPPTAFESLRIESKNGSATLKIGFLLQPQYEAISNATLSGTSNNLFVRRTRLLIGGTLFKNFEYFFDTDAPNLFKGSDTPVAGAAGMPATPASGAKGGNGIIVQDAFGTWKAYEDMVKVDLGYMLTPGAHNALQGAGTLYGLDYFSNTFLHNTSFNTAAGVNPAGRDAGAQLRGLLVDGHVEYRLGIFQGKRNPATATEVGAQNMFRVAGRLQINIFDPETAFFYAGTYLGKKKVLSVGAAYDFQSDYKHWAVDGFLDMPLGPGGVTAQVNFGKWNGGGFTTGAPPLVNQTAIMAEAGYRLDAIPISPILKFEQRDFANSDQRETRFGGGLAYWPYGHTINMKAFLTHISAKPDVGDSLGSNQFQLQGQLYFY